MKTRIKLYFDKVSIFHEGYCSGAECEYEVEENSKTMIIPMPPDLLGKYDDDDEIPVTHEWRMKYKISEERCMSYKGGLSGFCEKLPTNDQRIQFIIDHWVCNENTYLLTKIEVLE